jgi:hypothetical protein
MTDVTINEAPSEAAGVVQAITVPLKSDCGEVQVVMANLPDDVYAMVMLEGLKSIINSVGMSKLLPGITKLEGAEKDKAVAAVKAQADANVKALYEGTINKRGRKAKTSGAVQTEAMRLAKMLVKDHIRNSGQKIGAYSAKEITEAAKKVLEGNPRLIIQAQANLDERAVEAKTTGGLDLTALFGAKASTEEVKAKPKTPPKPKAKGEGKAPLSAKQASLVAPRQKPTGATAH